MPLDGMTAWRQAGSAGHGNRNCPPTRKVELGVDNSSIRGSFAEKKAAQIQAIENRVPIVRPDHALARRERVIRRQGPAHASVVFFGWKPTKESFELGGPADEYVFRVGTIPVAGLSGPGNVRGNLDAGPPQRIGRAS